MLIVGAALVVEGAQRKFKDGFKLAEMPPLARRTVWVLGTVGNIARGLVFAVTGFFLIQAAWHYDPSKARGLDGALRRLPSPRAAGSGWPRPASG